MKKNSSILIGLLLLLSSCATQRGIMQDGMMRGDKGRLAYSKNSSFFFWGLGQEDAVDVIEICGTRGNVSYVESKLTAGNVILGALTGGIYAPVSKKVYCKE